MRVKYLIFCSLGGWCYSGWWVWDLRILPQLQGSEMKTRCQSKVLSFGWFCVWCKSRGMVSQKFPCVTPVMESFSSVLLLAISYWMKSHLKSCQTCTIELFSQNSQQPRDVDYFCRKASPQMFDWIPNVLPIEKVL